LEVEGEIRFVLDWRTVARGMDHLSAQGLHQAALRAEPVGADPAKHQFSHGLPVISALIKGMTGAIDP
jgi:hypothetical protein